MGMFFSKAWSSLFDSDPISIVMIGLDAAGKTTILYKLKLGEFVIPTIPTVGFNVETVRYKNLNFTVWDIGGQTLIRPFHIWKHYYCIAKGVIYVVDTNDISRIDEARDELNAVLTAEELRDASLLVFANKQDLPNSMPCAEIAKRLGLAEMGNRSWHIQASSAPSGDGLYEGLDWLARDLSTRKI